MKCPRADLEETVAVEVEAAEEEEVREAESAVGAATKTGMLS